MFPFITIGALMGPLVVMVVSTKWAFWCRVPMGGLNDPYKWPKINGALGVLFRPYKWSDGMPLLKELFLCGPTLVVWCPGEFRGHISEITRISSGKHHAKNSK